MEWLDYAVILAGVAFWLPVLALVVLWLWSFRPGRARRKALGDDVTIARGTSYFRRRFHEQDLDQLEAEGRPLWKPDPDKLQRGR